MSAYTIALATPVLVLFVSALGCGLCRFLQGLSANRRN